MVLLAKLKNSWLNNQPIIDTDFAKSYILQVVAIIDGSHFFIVSMLNMYIMLRLLVAICLLNTLLCINIYAQSLKPAQFLSFEYVPTWVGLISDWQATPRVHFYDTSQYKGHATFVNKGLKRTITFDQFKKLVRAPASRQYLPVFVYDLQTMPVRIGSQTYEWVLMVEDYSYQDTPEQIVGMLQKAYQTMQQFLTKEPYKLGKNGLILLAKNKANKINIDLIFKLNKLGLEGITSSKLLELTKAHKPKQTQYAPAGIRCEVLNEGIAIGYLRYIDSEHSEQTGGNIQQILVYERTPHRVPIANGIITIEAQTPLSHIQLLAQNRQTPNAYLSNESNASQLRTLQGQLVQITFLKKEKQLIIKPIDIKTAQLHWAKLQKLQIQLPAIDTSTRHIIHFDTSAPIYLQANCIGTKAANYAWLQHAQPAYVRKGYAIPFYYYQQIVIQSGADKTIQEFLYKKDTLQNAATTDYLARIRQQIRATHLPAELWAELKQIVETPALKNKRIRFRSSTNCEDLPQFNGAGLYLSNGVDSRAADSVMERKLLDVYASLWEELPYQEREFFQLPHYQVGMAVLINESFVDEYANGVAITQPTSAGNWSVVANTQLGDRAVTNPESGDRPEVIEFATATSAEFILRSASNYGAIFAKNPTLLPVAQQLRDATNAIHEQLIQRINPDERAMFGVDIEFKIMLEAGVYRLYIKQARLLRHGTLPE